MRCSFPPSGGGSARASTRVSTLSRRQRFRRPYFARSHSIPVIYDMQSSLPEQLIKYRAFRTGAAQAVLRRCERWLLKRVNWVISSSGLAELVHGSAPETSVREWAFVGDPAIPSEAEVARLRAELGIGPHTRVVLYTGTFEEYQGLPVLLSAVPLVRSAVPGTLFVLVGARGADPIPVAEGCGYGREAVRILPRQPRERIPAFLALADVVVSPRAYGGNIPLKIFDYLAAGRPIVATDLPTHRSILNEDRAELVPATARGFAEAIVRLLQDPDHARRLADAGSAYAQEHLSWDRFEKTVEEVYESACEAVPRPKEAA